jgi:hypothetical protein
MRNTSPINTSVSFRRIFPHRYAGGKKSFEPIILLMHILITLYTVYQFLIHTDDVEFFVRQTWNLSLKVPVPDYFMGIFSANMHNISATLYW